MSMFSRVVLTLLCLCFFTSLAVAQKNERRKVPSQPANQKARTVFNDQRKNEVEIVLRQQRALWMLDSAAEKARGLEGSIIKARILALIADALWKHDNLRARSLFADSLNVLDSLNLDATKDQPIAATTPPNTPARLADLRSEIFQMIARRDFKLAEKLRTTIKEPRNDSTGNGQSNQSEKTGLAWDIAVAIAKEHPEQTAWFVRAQLRNGIHPLLGDALIGIRHENPQLANQLFNEAIVVARRHLTTLDPLDILAEYVLPSEGEASPRSEPVSYAHRIAIHNFLNYAANLLASHASVGNPVVADLDEAQHEYRTLQVLLPLFAKLMPGEAPVVRDRMTALTAAMTPQQRDALSGARQEEVEELVREAESTIGDRKRDLRFMRASMSALRLGDFERAILIAERISDPEERSIQTSLLTYQTALGKLQKDGIDEAHRLSQRIEFLPQRVAIVNLMAGKLRAKHDYSRANVLIEEIWEWTNKRKNTPQKAKALLMLTATMANYDAQRGFEFLRSAVSTIDRTDFGPPETIAKPSRVLHVTLDMLDFDASFSQLARLDFELAAEAAQSFATKEASLLAQVIVCRQGLVSITERQSQKLFSK